MKLPRIYVIRTFVRAGGETKALPPTICFERDLALEMAEADQPEAEGVAVYELEPCAHSQSETKPIAIFGLIPDRYWNIGRDVLLAAAEIPAARSS